MNRIDVIRTGRMAIAAVRLRCLWLVLAIGMAISPLLGTTSECHMTKVQTSAEIELEAEEMSKSVEVSTLVLDQSPTALEPRLAQTQVHLQPEQKPPPA